MRTADLFTSFIYFAILLLSGCEQQNQASIFLEKACILADAAPHQALKLIDSIKDPENSLSKKKYMQYLVAHTQIYHKNYLNIEDDTLIFNAIRYYTDKQTIPRQIALAYFYGGAVLKNQTKYDSAMVYYKHAETFAKKSSDNQILGLILYNVADLLAEQGQYDQASTNYFSAAKLYDRNPVKQANSFSSIGRMYLLKQFPDSALFYFNKGLKIADDSKDVNLQRQISESLAVAYEQIENYQESQKYLRNSFSLNSDSTKLTRYYLNFAILYDKMSIYDSTEYYTKKLKNALVLTKDNYLRASILSFLINYEKTNHNISAAFDYQSDRMRILTQIMKERENQSIYKIEKRYNYEQIKKEYYKSISIKQRWIILLMGIVITGGILFLFYRTKQKKQQLTIQNKIETLSEMNTDLESRIQEKQSDLRRELLWRFDITKKFLKLNEEISKKGRNSTESGIMLKQFNTIVYGQSSPDEQWDILLQAFEQARPTYSEKIRQNFPQISETEFRIAVLTYADFSIKEIALILKHSPNTIQTRRTSLRKKLGIENWGDIADFIDKMRA